MSSRPPNRRCPLGHQARTKRPIPLSGYVQRDRPDFAMDRFRGRAVTRVRVRCRVYCAFLVPQLARQLRLQTTFKSYFNQGKHKTTITSQPHLPRINLSEQDIKLPQSFELVNQALTRRPTQQRLNEHSHDYHRSFRHGLHKLFDTPDLSKYVEGTPLMLTIRPNPA